jgi:hypothetical protein
MPSGGATADAAHAYNILDGFDRSRDRFTADAAAISKGQHYAETIAANIQRGPEIGLTPQTRDRIPIYVSVLPQSATNAGLADYLSHKLADNGFQMVGTRDDAALVVLVTLEGFELHDHVNIGGFLGATSKVRATMLASWTTNNASLFTESLTSMGSLKYVEDPHAADHVNAEAERGLVTKIIVRLEGQSEK